MKKVYDDTVLIPFIFDLLKSQAKAEQRPREMQNI